jgi:AhpD family alkylhydroperoxidase
MKGHQQNATRLDGLKLPAMLALEEYVKKSSRLEPSLLELVRIRSQINGCAYCLDMHSKDARASEKRSSGCML